MLHWLAQRLAHLRPARRAGQGGTPPLPLEVRLDALGAAVVLDGLSYRRAARMVGICKTEVGDSLDLLLGELAALGLCQPDGTLTDQLVDNAVSRVGPGDGDRGDRPDRVGGAGRAARAAGIG